MNFKSFLNDNSESINQDNTVQNTVEQDEQMQESFGNIKNEMKELNRAISIIKDKLNEKSSFAKEVISKFEDDAYSKWFKENFESVLKIDKFLEDLEADLHSVEKA